jgi:hypothetical protein
MNLRTGTCLTATLVGHTPSPPSSSTLPTQSLSLSLLHIPDILWPNLSAHSGFIVVISFNSFPASSVVVKMSRRFCSKKSRARSLGEGKLRDWRDWRVREWRVSGGTGG